LADPKSVVKVREETIKSTKPADGIEEPTRTEFEVRILVPPELTARALQDRLLEKGDLLKLIKEKMLVNDVNPETNVIVHAAPMIITKHSVAIDDDHEPLIVLDTDIRGIYYDKLSASPECKLKFVEAVQGGIVAHTTGLDPKSIGLDVSDAGENAGLPFVHVTAKIPVPAGLSADATMSKWPQGSPQIGVEIQKRLRDLGECCFEQITRVAGKGPHDIEVFPSALHLGAVRANYAVHLKVNVDVLQLDHTEGGGHPAKSVIKKKIHDALTKMAQVEEDDVTIVEVEDKADVLKYKAEIRARGAFATSAKIADWEQRLLPVGRQLQGYFKQNYLASVKKDYVVMVGLGEVVNDVDTVDLDLVVHGIDYQGLNLVRKKAFLTPFVKAVREGLVLGTDNYPWVKDHVEKIHITVSPRDTDDALNVRAQIPAPDKPVDVHDLITRIESNVLLGDEPNLQLKVKDKLREIEGIAFLSTWTPDAIAVSIPGKVGINDFAGDVAGHMDHLVDQMDKA